MFFVFVFILIALVSNVFSDVPNVVILSFDGIHRRNISKENTPLLVKLAKDSRGAGPFELHSIFPSKTLVTHFTVSTGTYPNGHGVYNNEMFSTTDDSVLSNKQEQFQTKPQIVPIWIENQKAGNGRNSGMMMWPGGEFNFNGTEAKYIEKYNRSTNWNDRVQKIVEWMTRASDKANLVMAYFEDTPCYDKSKVNDHMKSHLGNIDATIEKLYKDLKLKMQAPFDMIVMSDHGTQRVEYDNVLKISTYLGEVDVNDYSIIISGPVLFIKVKGDIEAVMQRFDGLNESNKKYLAYKVNELTDRFNLGLTSLKNVIIVIAEPGYTFFDDAVLAAKVSEVGDQTNFVTYENGYDNWNRHMDGFLVGIGKNFQSVTYTTVDVELVDIYQMLKFLLDLKTQTSISQPLEKISEAVREILVEGIPPARIDTTSEATREEGKETEDSDSEGVKT